MIANKFTVVCQEQQKSMIARCRCQEVAFVATELSGHCCANPGGHLRDLNLRYGNGGYNSTGLGAAVIISRRCARRIDFGRSHAGTYVTKKPVLRCRKSKRLLNEHN